MEKMNWAATLIGAAVVAGAVAAAYFEFVAVSLTGLTAPDFVELFATVFFAALVIERATEVFVKAAYGEKEREVTRPVRLAQMSLTRATEAMAAERELSVVVPGDADATRAMVAARQERVAILQREADAARAVVDMAVADNKAKIDEMKVATNRFGRSVALALSLAAAVAVVRVFGQFLDGDATMAPYQTYAFRFTDVVLTTLVLAGGADGVHQLMADFLKRKNGLGNSTG